MAGSVAPESEKPLPLTLAEFTVTGAVPVELSSTGCDTAVFTSTLPNPRDVPLTLKAAAPVEGEMVMLNVVDTPPATAVIVATCVVATLATDALKLAVVAPDLTVTRPGTVTAGSLLVRVTWTHLLVVDVRETEQASVDAPL